jgi:hypothetical protein
MTVNPFIAYHDIKRDEGFRIYFFGLSHFSSQIGGPASSAISDDSMAVYKSYESHRDKTVIHHVFIQA